MTDRPIIFSGPMVRARLAGRKTQTRRLATSPLRRVDAGPVTELIGAAGDTTHPWVSRYGMEICADCGIVRRRDRMNSPCKGKVKVALRDTEGDV